MMDRDDPIRVLLLEQIGAVRTEIQSLTCRLRERDAVAQSVARSHLALMEARCNAMRGLIGAEDWEG